MTNFPQSDPSVTSSSLDEDYEDESTYDGETDSDSYSSAVDVEIPEETEVYNPAVRQWRTNLQSIPSDRVLPTGEIPQTTTREIELQQIGETQLRKHHTDLISSQRLVDQVRKGKSSSRSKKKGHRRTLSDSSADLVSPYGRRGQLMMSMSLLDPLVERDEKYPQLSRVASMRQDHILQRKPSSGASNTRRNPSDLSKSGFSPKDTGNENKDLPPPTTWWGRIMVCMGMNHGQNTEERVIFVGPWDEDGKGGEKVSKMSRKDSEEHRSNQCYVDNKVTTSKYSLVSFLPKNLYEQFHRITNLYFLLIAGLTWWREVSPFDPFGSNFAIGFILTVGAVKDAIEDMKRHREDDEQNTKRKAQVLTQDGSYKSIPWKDVLVGMLVKVNDGEQVPADMVLLRSSLEGNVAFIQTTNLDGESNLKMRNTVGQLDIESEAHLLSLQGDLTCEAPNTSLSKFEGKLNINGKSGNVDSFPLSINEMLLRGVTLKNTGHIVGVVVYTGPETRIMQNSTGPPSKQSSFDRFINRQLIYLVTIQLSLTIFCAAGSVIWREWAREDTNNFGERVWYLQLDEDDDTAFVAFIKAFFTFFILFSYLVPISLVISMEVVKFIHATLLINNDLEMYNKDLDEPAKARTSSLSEDLGSVGYVFSDKTGTLTCNDMRLRMISIRGYSFGSTSFRLEDYGGTSIHDCLEKFDPTLTDLLQRGEEDPKAKLAIESGEVKTSNPDGLSFKEVEDYFTVLSACHTILVTSEEKDDPDSNDSGPPKALKYQGSSPDEVALVEAAARLGAVFESRTASTATLYFGLGKNPKRITLEVMTVLEFSSDRKRMSVILRMPDGSVKLLCKGADSVILARLRDQGRWSPEEENALDATVDQLEHYSLQGLRTLMIAQRTIPDDEWKKWQKDYRQASQLIGPQRDAAMNACAERIEQNLELVGATAIEDRLQDEVPKTIDNLRRAHIGVWMITGDKQETAINIGMSCNLIRNPTALMKCNASSYERAKVVIEEISKFAIARGLLKEDDTIKSSSGSSSVSKGKDQYEGLELVVDGETLGYVLGTDLEQKLVKILAACDAVIVCRASPLQKASMVVLMRQFTKKICLAIGDGANDVGMIQVANVGVGIFGREGRQAVNNSDYAIGEFRFLENLILYHGQLFYRSLPSKYRLSRLIKYSFYKNIVFMFTLFLFTIFAGFSGQSTYGSVQSALYNVAFSSLPIFLVATIDKDLYSSTLRENPELYGTHKSLNKWVFWKATLDAVLHSSIAFFVTILVFVSFSGDTNTGTNDVSDLDSVGNVLFTVVLSVITAEIVLDTRSWTILHLGAVLLVYFGYFPFLWVFPYFFVDTTTGITGEGVAAIIYGDVRFYLAILLAVSITFGYRLALRYIKWQYSPDDSMILAEIEYLKYRHHPIPHANQDRQDTGGGNGADQGSVNVNDNVI